MKNSRKAGHLVSIISLRGVLHRLGDLAPGALLSALLEQADVLVDVHDCAELRLELAELGPDLRGVPHDWRSCRGEHSELQD